MIQTNIPENVVEKETYGKYYQDVDFEVNHKLENIEDLAIEDNNHKGEEIEAYDNPNKVDTMYGDDISLVSEVSHLTSPRVTEPINNNSSSDDQSDIEGHQFGQEALARKPFVARITGEWSLDTDNIVICNSITVSSRLVEISLLHLIQLVDNNLKLINYNQIDYYN